MLLLLALAACGGSLDAQAAPRLLLNATNTVWKYFPAVTNPSFATPWAAPDFDDSLWAEGRGLFGYENSSSYPHRFQTWITPPSSGGPITTYFRARFHWTGSPTNVLLTATNYIDDGAVFYLNGVEVYRFNMPDGVPAYDTLAPTYPDEPSIVVVDLPASTLVEDENVLAVELHQTGGPSSDVVFGMWLHARDLVPPMFTNPGEPTDRSVLQCRSTVLSAAATSDFPIHYQWYHDGTPITGATSAVHAITRMATTDAGEYFCRVSNRVAAVDSRTATVAFVPDESPPTPIYALASLDRRTVTIRFDEPLLSGSGEGGAENPARYTLRCPDDPGRAIRLASNAPPVLQNLTNVVLSVDPDTPLPPDLDGEVTITGVGDACTGRASAVPVAMAVASQVLLIGNDSGARWRYQADGVDLGTDWRTPGYDDSAWPWGEAVFDGVRSGPRGTVNGQIVRTRLAVTNALFPAASIPSYYFRTQFQFPGDPQQAKLWLRPFWDDGAVLYLNGQEAFRLRAGTNDAFGSYGLSTSPQASASFEGPFALPLTNVVAGANSLGVFLKQVSSVNADITMGLELIAEVLHLPPRVTIGCLADGAIEIRWFGSGVLQSSPYPSGGEWTDMSDTSPCSVAPVGRAQFYRVRK